MEKGKEICVKRDRIYGETKYRYQKGIIEGVYRHHILVKFICNGGNSYKESFFEHEIIEIEEVEDGENIY